MITRPVCKSIQKLRTANAGATMDISYRDLTAGFVIGTVFSLFSFMLGFYAEIAK